MFHRIVIFVLPVPVLVARIYVYIEKLNIES